MFLLRVVIGPLVGLVGLLGTSVQGQTTTPVRPFTHQTENVALITLDGVRWQEIFAGADPMLLVDQTYSPNLYQVWLAAIGPDTPATGEQTGGAVVFQHQIAATLARLPGYEFQCEHAVGAPILGLMNP